MPEKPTLSTRMAAVEGTLKAVVTNLGEINTTLKLANGGGKKPRRLEIMGAAIVGLVGLSELGVLEGLKAVVYNFFSGGAG